MTDRASRGPRGPRLEPEEKELPATPKSGTEDTSALLPPPFDVSELGNYANAGRNQEVSFG
jgi:hypothetical protein